MDRWVRISWAFTLLAPEPDLYIVVLHATADTLENPVTYAIDCTVPGKLLLSAFIFDKNYYTLTNTSPTYLLYFRLMMLTLFCGKLK